jgi:hypothetical protein
MLRTFWRRPGRINHEKREETMIMERRMDGGGGSDDGFLIYWLLS